MKSKNHYGLEIIVVVIVAALIAFIIWQGNMGKFTLENGCFLILAVAAFGIANLSLIETRKTRHDMFLPIITTLGISGGKSGATAAIEVRNIGHGTAFDVKVCLSGADCVEITDECPPSYDMIKHKPFTLPKGPCNDAKLTIIYNDVFGRTISTMYKVILTPNPDGYYAPRIDRASRKIVLP